MNPADPVAIRTATTDDMAAIRRTLGRAFADDPVAEWLLGRRMNEKRIGYLDATLARGHLPHGISTITANAEAVAIWAPPKRFKIAPKEVARHLPGVLARLGPSGFSRMLAMAETEELHPAEPHYYLAVLGTDPAHQGKGMGTAAIAPALARADEEAVGCYLESSKESNIAFYRRHGFEVTDTHDIASGKGPRLWLMWRDPQPPGP